MSSRYALFTPESRAPSSTSWTASLAANNATAAAVSNNNAAAAAEQQTRHSTPFGMSHNYAKNNAQNYLPGGTSFSGRRAGGESHYRGKNSTNGSNTNNATMPYELLYQRLNFYYGTVKRQLMRHQDEASGLFRTHDNGTTAHVRDNIYCAAALWSLSRAYQRIDNDDGRSRELSLCCVKTMRRILLLWMNEARRLENFKNHQAPENAMHCKFYVDARLLPVPDRDYPHLQIDAVGLYIIFLTQMIASGLDIIFTSDEVNFVQNLVFYLERAYRTPDFGIWERGDKYNTGQAELHASSIGTAKVALECINAFNLFGERGASWSVAYVDVDAHNRNRTTLEFMLPRESNSKNTDAALLCTLSFPVFAMHAPEVVQTSMDKIRRKLLGRYGFKRFLRDGYGTAYDRATTTTNTSFNNRSSDGPLPPLRYYESSEIHKFDGIESEWPIFFAYLIIDGVFHDDYAQVQHYQALLEPLLRESYEGDLVLPKYYYVPEEQVEAERSRPGSQHRLPSDDAFDDLQQHQDGKSNEKNPTFLWGQAVFIISQLLVEGILHANDLDPLRLHLPSSLRYSVQSKRYSSFSGTAAPQDLAVQVCLIAESFRLQRMLATYGIATQTPAQVAPIQIWSPTDLMNIYSSLGRNDALGLSGRPKRPFGVLSTSKVYRICGITVVCYPLFVDISDFYLSFDISVLMDDICAAFAFVTHRWSLAHGRPTVVLLIREDNFSGPQASGMLNLLASFRSSRVNSNGGGVHVKLGTLQTFLASSCVEQLDFVVDTSFVQQYRIRPLKERAPSDDGKSSGLLLAGGGATIFDMVQRGQTPTPETGQALVKQRRRMSMMTSATNAADGPTPIAGDQRRRATQPLLNLASLQQHCQQAVHQLLTALRSLASVPYSPQAALVLCALYRKEGPHFIVDARPNNVNVTVQQLLERTVRFAASNGEWQLVRYCSAVMRKVVDSLAPSVTTMLVRSKLLTVGVFGQRDEIVIDKPITPADLASAIYGACEPHDLTAACVQQEVILNVGKLLEAYPQLFDGILKIRIGWIVQAMAMYKAFTTSTMQRGSRSLENTDEIIILDGVDSLDDTSSSSSSIDSQPPAHIKDLTVKVLCLPFEGRAADGGGGATPRASVISRAAAALARQDSSSERIAAEDNSVSSLLLTTSGAGLLSPHQRRQIDGCLGRVPERFYDHVWYILQHATDGIRIAGATLPQQPTLTEMSLSELRFALQVDALLDRCMYPAYRQLVVELLLVVNVILQRNPECRFGTLLDTDALVVQALEKFASLPQVASSVSVPLPTPSSSAAECGAAEIENNATGRFGINQHYYAATDDDKPATTTVVSNKPRLSSIPRQATRQQHSSPPMKHYNEHASKFSEDEWQRFYNQPATITANFFAAVVANKLLDELRLRTLESNQSASQDFSAANDNAVVADLLPSCALS